MDEVIVTGTDDPDPGEDSAHQAAIAEGATAVHAVNAGESAEEAKNAAEAALASAQANIEATAAAQESAQRAEAAAEQTGVTLEMLHEALTAQSASMNAFMEEIRASRKETKPKPEPVEHKKDEPPKPKKQRNRSLFMR